MSNVISLRVYDFLKNYPPFDAVSEEELMRISSKLKVWYLDKGRIIFSEGEQPGDYFFVVKAGAVGLSREVEGESILVDICDEGDVFGLRPLIQDDHYLMSAVCQEETILYQIPVKAFKAVADQNESVRKYLRAGFFSNLKTPYANEDKTFNSTWESSIFTDVQTAGFKREPIHTSPSKSIQEVALIMSESRIGSMIITEQQKPIGIVTDKDLRMKVATGKVGLSEPISQIMSSPVHTIPPNISVAEAQIEMIKHQITHLVVTENGQVDSPLLGVMSEHDLVVLKGNNSSVLMKEIKRAKVNDKLVYVRQRLSHLLKGYVEQQVPISFSTHLFEELNRSLTAKAIQLSIQEMGHEPTVSFSWLSLGSQGRGEQLLLTDQDNAIVYENVPQEQAEITKNYFLELAQKVTHKLNNIGYEYCPANMMASNPQWCLSLDEWKAQFHHWITQPSEKSIMNCTIFFDFKSMYGNQDLGLELSKSIQQSIQSYDLFLNYLGQNALTNPSPVGFFRQFLVEQDGKHKHQFDLKARALMPLIDAARLLILSQPNEFEITNTSKRYQRLMELEPQNKELYNSCADAFEVLLQFRTEQGLKNQDSGRFVPIESLSKVDRLKLKNAFKPIKDIQELIMTRFKLSQLM